MIFLTAIGYLAVVIAMIYLVSFTVVKIYESKKKVIYQNMLEQLVLLEEFKLTTAVMHAKTYRIMADYHQNMVKLEKMQRFILKIMLLGYKKTSGYGLR